jgi:hypothetical protein
MLLVEQDEQKLTPNEVHNSDIRITFPLTRWVIQLGRKSNSVRVFSPSVD